MIELASRVSGILAGSITSAAPPTRRRALPLTRASERQAAGPLACAPACHRAAPRKAALPAPSRHARRTACENGASPSARGLHRIIRCGISKNSRKRPFAHSKGLAPTSPAALQQPRRNCNCQCIQGFRFPKVRHATRRAKAARCNAAFALPGCAMDNPAATKACYKKAQAVETRVPLD